MDRHVFSAKLNFTSPENQDYMVSGLAEAGQLQLLVVDTESMQSIFARLATQWQLIALGDAFGKPIYQIGPRLAP